MKVKNIMFSGFAAAILAGMCGSADAATVLASKTYVDNQVKTRQAPLSAENDSITIENVTDASGNVTGAKIRANLPSLSGLATESYVQERIAEIDIPTTEGLATTEQVEEALATKQNVLTAGEGINITETTDETTGAVTTTIKTNIDLSGLATKGEIANMATTGYVDGKTADIATLNTDVAQLKTDVAGKQDELVLGDNLQWVDGKLDTKGIATADGLETLETKVNVLAGSAETEGSVKQQVAAALEAAKQYADANDSAYDDTALAGRVMALEGAGYQNASQVEAAISDATIQMDKVDGLDTALGAKADASALSNYATAASVNALTGTDGAITKNTAAIAELQAAGYQTAKDVEDKIEAGNFLSDTMTANGTYLVQQTDSGVSYYAISIVDGDGKDIATGQPVVE